MTPNTAKKKVGSAVMERVLAQNIYDLPEFFEGYSRLPRSVHGLDGAPEWPAIRALLPDLKGKAIVDLGCGFGWFARWTRTQGALHVLGLDLSRNMLSRAQAETKDPAVQYAIANLEELELPEGVFDLAYSSLALHYIQDFGKLVRTVCHALVPGGQFIFSIEHPIYMAPMSPKWVVGEDGRKIWPLESYAIEGRRTTEWLAKGVVKHHRTVGTTLNTLIRAGFTISHVEEWCPTPDQVTAQPALVDEMNRPMILLIAAHR